MVQRKGYLGIGQVLVHADHNCADLQCERRRFHTLKIITYLAVQFFHFTRDVMQILRDRCMFLS